MIYVCVRHWCRRNILSMPLGQSSYRCEANIFSLSLGTAKGFFIYDDESCHRYSILSLIPSLLLSLFSLKHITCFLLCVAFLTVYKILWLYIVLTKQFWVMKWISWWGEIRILHIKKITFSICTEMGWLSIRKFSCHSNAHGTSFEICISIKGMLIMKCMQIYGLETYA